MVVEKKKYIIELPENTHGIQWIMESTKDHHPYMDYKQVEDLTPYTEDSAYAHGYTEAESKYREIRDELEKQAYQRGYEKAYDTAYADAEEIYESGKRAMYQKGLKDAWEAARKICLEEDDGGIPASAIKDIFNVRNYRYAVKDYSASEAIEKIRQYEQKQEEIKVGDEVEAMAGNAVVIEVIDGGQTVRYMYPDTITGRNKACNVTRTGRHFPQIAEVLQKMKEAQ